MLHVVPQPKAVTQGEIGVLDKQDMDHFADVFMAYQRRGKISDPKGLSSFYPSRRLTLFALRARRIQQDLATFQQSQG